MRRIHLEFSVFICPTNLFINGFVYRFKEQDIGKGLAARTLRL